MKTKYIITDDGDKVIIKFAGIRRQLEKYLQRHLSDRAVSQDYLGLNGVMELRHPNDIHSMYEPDKSILYVNIDTCRIYREVTLEKSMYYEGAL